MLVCYDIDSCTTATEDILLSMTFSRKQTRAVQPNKVTKRPVLHCVTRVTRMWANAQRDGRPAEYRWRPLFNAAKFG